MSTAADQHAEKNLFVRLWLDGTSLLDAEYPGRAQEMPEADEEYSRIDQGRQTGDPAVM